MKSCYLWGRGGQLSSNYCCDWAGPNCQGLVPVWDRAGFRSGWTRAKARTGTWGRRSPPLLAASHVQGGLANLGLHRAWCLWLIEGVGSENGVKVTVHGPFTYVIAQKQLGKAVKLRLTYKTFSLLQRQHGIFLKLRWKIAAIQSTDTQVVR